MRDVVRGLERALGAIQCDGRQVARRQVVVVVEIEWARAVLGSSQAAISERNPGEEEGIVVMLDGQMLQG